MNPKPSLTQCLVLHEIDDDGVWFDLASGKWHSTYTRGNVTTQVTILHRDGYINIVDDQVSLTPMGRQVLARRPYGDLVERINSR